ncbi:MAG: hypothetical protein DMG06_22330 [Acidobacteria bacterium]|nr:MAG: hypothetical protein DMG06_22330 [Acidobacteriota bacterium]
MKQSDCDLGFIAGLPSLVREKIVTLWQKRGVEGACQLAGNAVLLVLLTDLVLGAAQREQHARQLWYRIFRLLQAP